MPERKRTLTLGGMIGPDELLSLVERHLARSGETARKFGLRAVKDPNLVKDLRDGREPRRATVTRIVTALGESRQSPRADMTAAA